MKLSIVFGLLLSGAAIWSCKRTETQTAVKDNNDARNVGEEAGRDKGFVNDLAGRTDAKVVREKVAQILGANPNSEMFNIQFGLYRCTTEALISAATMGKGGSEAMYLVDLSVSLLDIFYPMLETLRSKDLEHVANADPLRGITWFDQVKFVGAAVVSAFYNAGEINQVIAVSGASREALQPFIDEMIANGVKLTFDTLNPMEAGKLQQAFMEYFNSKGKYPQYLKLKDLLWDWAGHYGDIEMKSVAKTSAIISVAMPLLRCAVAIGEGSWALGKETYGLSKDLVALRATSLAVDRACPNYDAFVECRQVCGGQGSNSDFANQKAAGRCDQDPALRSAYRGMVVAAYQSSCYEMFCEQRGTKRVANANGCMITANSNRYFRDPVAGKDRKVDEFESDCCDPSKANYEKCSAMAGFGR